MTMDLVARMEKGPGRPALASGTNWIALVACLLITIPAIAWLTQVDFFSSHDGGMHRWRFWEYWELFRSGSPLPRWAPDLAYGFGSPVFSYYNPLPYLLGATGQAWGLSATDALKAVYALALVASALGMYALAVEWLAGRPAANAAAVLSAAAYLYNPYILVNVSIRGAVSEALALGIAPWLFWAELRAIRRGDAASYLALSVAVAALLLTHNLTSLICAAIALALAVAMLVRRETRWRNCTLTAGGLGIAAGLGLALAAFYWIPATAEMNFVQLERDTGGANPIYLQRFVPLDRLVQLTAIHDYWQDLTVESPSEPHLGLVWTAVLFVAVVTWLWRKPGRRPREAVLLAGIALALFMITPLSRGVWQAIPFLAFFQYPWRFLGAVALLGSLVAGGLALRSRGTLAVAIMVGLGLIASGMWVRIEAVDWWRGWETSSNLRAYERETGLPGLTSFDEFLPRWVERGRDSFYTPSARPLERSPAVQVSLIDARESYWRLVAEADQPAPLSLDVYYFPSWRVSIDGQPAASRPSGDMGLLTFDLPPGKHLVEIRQDLTGLQRISSYISISAVVAAIAAAVMLTRRRWRAKERIGFGLKAAGTSLLVVTFPLFLATLRPAPPPSYAQAPPDDAPTTAKLLGVRVDQSRLQERGQIDLAVLSLVAGGARAEEPDLAVRLTDDSGKIVAESAHRFGQGLRPVEIWRANQILTDRVELWLPPSAQAGHYTVHAALDKAPLRPIASFDLGRSGAREPFSPQHATFSAAPAFHWGDLVLNYGHFVPKQAGENESSGLVAGQEQTFRGELSWRRTSEALGDYEAVIQLVDAQGSVWQQVVDALALRAGEMRIQRSLDFRMPPDLPEGRYRVQLAMRQAKERWLDGGPVERPSSPRFAATLWEGNVENECGCVPERAIRAEAVLGDSIRLAGFERRVQGDKAIAVVYWQPTRGPLESYTSFVHLLDRDGKLVDQFDGIPFWGKLPSTDWQVGQVVPFAASFALPSEGGPFRLRAGMYDSRSLAPLPAADGRTFVPLGIVDRERPILGATVGFEDGVTLLGHRVDREENQTVLELRWQTMRPLGKDYSVFVHVLDRTGKLVAQADGPLELGERGSSEWQPGEMVIDKRRFVTPAEWPLSVRVGLYLLEGNRRLRTLSGSDFVDIGVIGGSPLLLEEGAQRR